MPGFIKVSGEQRPVAVPYIKVSGDWKPVAIGWVKVDGAWKIWHTAEIVDNFNRTDAPTLGLASNDFSEWTTLAGSWEVNTNQAKAGDTAGPHLASVPLYKANTDVTVEVDIPTGTGVGAAFWVNDATNWWAAIPGRRTQNNPSFYSCPSGFRLEGTRCVRTTSYSATYVNPSTIQVPFCPSPYTDNGVNCVVSLYPEYGVTSTGVGCRGVQGCQSLAPGATCFYSQVCADLGLGPCNCVIVAETCVCQPFGGSCSGCSGTQTTGYSYNSVSFPGGYTCPQGGSLSGTTCTLTENNAATFNPATITYPSVMRVYKSVGGAVTTELQSDITSDPRSIQVTVSGNNVNIKSYALAGVTGTPYSSLAYTTSNAAKTTSVGIIKNGNQGEGQTNNIDNFRAE